MEKLLAEAVSERERTMLETGVSNVEFQYLGSPTILGGIGKAFAEAMVQLKNK